MERIAHTHRPMPAWCTWHMICEDPMHVQLQSIQQSNNTHQTTLLYPTTIGHHPTLINTRHPAKYLISRARRGAVARI
eukprot:scaffold39422_cov37-Tisochrysis_lutea.AAC.1